MRDYCIVLIPKCNNSRTGELKEEVVAEEEVKETVSKNTIRVVMFSSETINSLPACVDG